MLGVRKRVFGELRFCNLCQIGQSRGEYHLVFECSALQGVRGKYLDLLGNMQSLYSEPYGEVHVAGRYIWGPHESWDCSSTSAAYMQQS